MNYTLRACAAFFAGSCLAFDASALSMKALKTHVVQFHESGVTLAAADRQAVATFAESLREADWCPLVVVIGEAKFLIDKHDTKTMAEARAAYVTNLLKRNGVPAQVLFFFVQPSPTLSASVEIEAVGSPSSPGCKHSRTEEGFRPSPPELEPNTGAPAFIR